MGKQMAPTAPNPSDAPADAKRDILERLLAAHAAWFDVSRDHSFAGRTFPGYAEFHSSAEKYVLTKRAKLWGASAHEYLFFTMTSSLSKAALDDLVAFMTTAALDKVKPDPEHMTSYLSLVIIADDADEDALRAARKAKFRKNFKLGLEGWADLRVAVVDVHNANVVTNAMGKELRATLEANAFPEGAASAKTRSRSRLGRPQPRRKEHTP